MDFQLFLQQVHAGRKVGLEFFLRYLYHSLADGDARSCQHHGLRKLQDGFLAFLEIIIDTFDVAGCIDDAGSSLQVVGFKEGGAYLFYQLAAADDVFE